MRNMYANRVARSAGSSFSRGKGRKLAMSTSSGYKRSWNHCNKSGQKKAQSFKLLRESDGESSPSVVQFTQH